MATTKKKEEQTGYQSRWQGQLDDITDKILNREKFSYDLNGDAFYDQYKDKFTRQGKMAMMDTMGQAAALTGGYGSSYAQQVGQQTYQGYLQNLNDVAPELYQLALDNYDRQGEALVQQYGLLADQDALDYSRHRDDVADRQYQQELAYQKQRDAIADSQWQQSFDYQKNRDSVADSQWQKQYDSLGSEETESGGIGGGLLGALGTIGKTIGGLVSGSKETGKTEKALAFKKQMDEELAQWKYRNNLSEENAASIITSYLNKSKLTDEEYRWLATQYGLI